MPFLRKDYPWILQLLWLRQPNRNFLPKDSNHLQERIHIFSDSGTCKPKQSLAAYSTTGDIQWTTTP